MFFFSLFLFWLFDALHKTVQRKIFPLFCVLFVNNKKYLKFVSLYFQLEFYIYLKLVDKFTYLGSSVSSTEKDIDTWLMMAWTAIDNLSIIWKSDLTDKMKHSFFQAVVILILLYRGTTWTLTKRLEKKQLHNSAASNIEQVLEATPHKASTIRPPTSHHKSYPN